MDFKLEQASLDDYTYNWDIVASNNDVEVVEDDAEEAQKVNIITFLVKGSVPLLEDYGTDWTGFLFKEITLTELNNQILENIYTYIGYDVGYYPLYETEAGVLKVTLNKITMQG